MFQNAKHISVLLQTMAFGIILSSSVVLAQTNYRQGSGLSAATAGQAQGLQSEAQMLNNLQMLQQIQQQEEYNRRQQEQDLYRQQQIQQQQQFQQIQMENERLKQQLLKQQLNQTQQPKKSSSSTSQIIQNNSVPSGGRCENASNCVGNLWCVAGKCTRK